MVFDRFLAAPVGFSFTLRFLGLTSFVEFSLIQSREGVPWYSYTPLAIAITRMWLGSGGGVEEVRQTAQ